jgi:hypothetical protein
VFGGVVMQTPLISRNSQSPNKKGLAPHIPSISMAGKGPEGSLYLRIIDSFASLAFGVSDPRLVGQAGSPSYPGNLLMPVNPYGKQNLLVTFGQYKVGKVGHTPKS